MSELKVEIAECDLDHTSSASMDGIRMLELYKKMYHHQGGAVTNGKASAAAATSRTDGDEARQQQVRDTEVLQLLSRYLAADRAAAAAAKTPLTTQKEQQPQRNDGLPVVALPVWNMPPGTEYIPQTCHCGKGRSSSKTGSHSGLLTSLPGNAVMPQAAAHDCADKLPDALPDEAADDGRMPEHRDSYTASTDYLPLVGHTERQGCMLDMDLNEDCSAEQTHEQDSTIEASKSPTSDANDRASRQKHDEAKGDHKLRAAGTESRAERADDNVRQATKREEHAMKWEEKGQEQEQPEQEQPEQEAEESRRQAEKQAKDQGKRQELQVPQDTDASKEKTESASDYDDDEDDVDGRSDSAGNGRAAGLWREDSVSSADSRDACDDCGLMTRSFAPGGQPFCRRCSARQQERREVVQEIIETEAAYIDDLAVLLNEFAAPLEQAALISHEQASVLFGRTAPLAAAARALLGELRGAVAQAADRGDACYGTARVGRAFLDCAPAVLLEFEAYCVAQEQARPLLDALRRERPLVDVFLEQSQLENARLRRMPLKSFLARPVQRTTQYPLLLRRLHKVTPQDSADRADVRRAAELIAAALSRIDPAATAGAWPVAVAAGSVGPAAPLHRVAPDAVDVVRLALHATGWPSDQLHVIVAGKVGYAQPADHEWWQRGAKRLSLRPAYAALVTRGRDRANLAVAASLTEAACASPALHFPQPAAGRVEDAAFVFASWRSRSQQLVPLLGGRPLRLGACVLARDAEYYDLLELSERHSGECIVFRPVQSDQGDLWYGSARRYCLDLDHQQLRRHAVPNLIARR